MKTPNRIAPCITLYTKPECGLCDEAKAVLIAMQRHVSFEMLEIDITGDPALYERFHEQIPAGFLDGRKVFKYRVDPALLRRQLQRRGRWFAGRWFSTWESRSF